MGWRMGGSARLFLLLFCLQVSSVQAAGPGQLNVSSPAFEENGNIPRQYTCDGKDVSPPLTIEQVPKQARSLALIVDDPDAPGGTWVHWVVWNIPPEVRDIKENTAPPGGAQGKNDFKKNGYGGPCPPGGTHRYFFKVYALDTTLRIGRDATASDLRKAMKGHVLAEGQLIGRYKR